MNQKLSVIVPIYNCEAYLNECVDSILRQTYENLEVILVDDGSMDSSGAICDAYEKRDGRVIVIHKNNEGPIKARLAGAEMAGGEYVTFVDGDDWLAPDAYTRMMSLMERCDVAMAGIFRYNGSDSVKKDIPMLEEGLYDREGIEKSVIPGMLWSRKRNEWELDPSLCTKIFKKGLLLKFLRKASKLDIHFGDDTAVIFPLMLKADSLAVTHFCYYYHRQRREGAVPSYFREEAYFEKLFSLYRYLKEEFSGSDYRNILYSQLERFYMNAVQLRRRRFLDYREEKEDIFPFWSFSENADVILYGAGVTGKKYFEQNEKYGFCNIVLWADRNYEKIQKEIETVVSPECILHASYDYLIIAVQSVELALGIWETLSAWNIPAEKVIWSGTSVQKIEMKKEDRISD